MFLRTGHAWLARAVEQFVVGEDNRSSTLEATVALPRFASALMHSYHFHGIRPTDDSGASQASAEHEPGSIGAFHASLIAAATTFAARPLSRGHKSQDEDSDDNSLRLRNTSVEAILEVRFRRSCCVYARAAIFTHAPMFFGVAVHEGL